MTSEEGSIITLLPETFVVVKCSPEKSLPSIPQDAGKKYSFITLSVTMDECSLIAPESYLEDKTSNRQDNFLDIDRNWRCFKVEGQLDFSLVGILHRILDPLKSAKISVLAVGTYNTDYFLIKKDKVAEARVALTGAGFQLREL